MRIAVVGAGITGLGAAYALSQRHEVVLYDREVRAGGHANTVEVKTPSGGCAVDTGFIVFNDRNYPHLLKLFERLGVPSRPSEMSFAFTRDGGRFEYAGSPGGLVAQRSNVLRPRVWVLMRDLFRFYRDAGIFLRNPEPSCSLGDFIRIRGYAAPFVEQHLLPMAAAIWSAPPAQILAFPAASFLQFFANHGLLGLHDRPQWRTVAGGSRVYVDRLLAALPQTALRLGRSIVRAERGAGGCTLTDEAGHRDRFDRVVFACHADVTLAILGRDASPAERSILGAFRFQANRAVLHSDSSLMPRRRGVWSSWNFLSSDGDAPDRPVCVSYWMNRLQSLPEELPLFVTLNPVREPRADLVHGTWTYEHPIFDGPAVSAQADLPSIQGVGGAWFCGAWCGHGFHEDGLEAGLAVAAALGSPAPWAREVRNASPAARIAPASPPLSVAAE